MSQALQCPFDEGCLVAFCWSLLNVQAAHYAQSTLTAHVIVRQLKRIAPIDIASIFYGLPTQRPRTASCSLHEL